ncbi:hypothetical protein GGI11_001791 [Coemansia sp. RSA 2049]|nr:hypothetical protein GGI11_001791 [Coemansia sp. RSA 2049]
MSTAAATESKPSRQDSKVIPSRGCEKYVEKFKSWDHLFRADGDDMKKDLGIGPKHRKWILMWVNKFRHGIDPYFIPTSIKHQMKRSERLARAKRRRLKQMKKK